jgi:hypothetical protein
VWLHQRAGSDVGQRRSAPLVAGLLQQVGGDLVAAFGERAPPLGGQVLVAEEVEVLRYGAEGVPAGPGDQHVLGHLGGRDAQAGAEQLAQVQHVGLQGGQRAGRWVAAPHLLEEFGGRDRLVGMQQQQGEERAGLAGGRA